MNILITAFIAIITGLISYGGALLTVKSSNKKANAEADDIVVDAASKVVALLRGEMSRLITDVNTLRTDLKARNDEVNKLITENKTKDVEIDNLYHHVRILEVAIRKLGGDIPSRP